MADNTPPATVPDLLAKVGQSVANIQAHRDAMAKVSAAIKGAPKGQAPKEVTPK